MPECEQDVRQVRGRVVAVRTRRQRLNVSLLGRDIALVLALKGALIAALYLFVFRPAPHPAQDSAATATAVVGATTTTVHKVQR